MRVRNKAGDLDALRQAVGIIGSLSWVIEFRRDGHPIRPHQREIAAARVEAEIGVQGRTRHAAVFARSKHDKKSAGGEICRGERPFSEVAGVIGEIPTVEIDGGAAGIVDLDPVRRVTIFVEQTTAVIGEKLADDHRLRWQGRRAADDHDCEC